MSNVERFFLWTAIIGLGVQAWISNQVHQGTLEVIESQQEVIGAHQELQRKQGKTIIKIIDTQGEILDYMGVPYIPK